MAGGNSTGRRRNVVATGAPAPRADDWRPESCGDLIPRFLDFPASDGGGKLEKADWPHHISSAVALFDRCIFEGDQRAVLHVPSQCGKSTLACAALVTLAWLKPGRQSIYVSYSAERSEAARRVVEAMAVKAGLAPTGSGEMLYLKGGSSIRFVGVQGGVSGFPGTGLVIADDLVKGHYDLTPAILDGIYEWLNSDLIQRVHSGCSVVVIGTRYHPRDVSGRLIEDGWPYLRIPAQCDGPNDPQGREIGAYLWPERRSAASWNLKKNNPRTWAAVCQGLPLDSEQQLFDQPSYYESRPLHGRHVCGLDLARSARNARADSSVLLHAIVSEGKLYVCSVVHAQLAQHKFRSMALSVYRNLPPSTPVGFWMGPNEAGYADDWRRDGLGSALRTYQTQGKPKRSRYELKLIPLWNEGRILLCDSMRGHAELAKQARQFDGSERTHDDLLDALAGAVEVAGLTPGGGARAPLYDRTQMRQLARSYSAGLRDHGGLVERPRVRGYDRAAERAIRRDMRETGLSRWWYPPTD